MKQSCAGVWSTARCQTRLLTWGQKISACEWSCVCMLCVLFSIIYLLSIGQIKNKKERWKSQTDWQWQNETEVTQTWVLVAAQQDISLCERVPSKQRGQVSDWDSRRVVQLIRLQSLIWDASRLWPHEPRSSMNTHTHTHVNMMCNSLWWIRTPGVECVCRQ